VRRSSVELYLTQSEIIRDHQRSSVVLTGREGEALERRVELDDTGEKQHDRIDLPTRL